MKNIFLLGAGVCLLSIVVAGNVAAQEAAVEPETPTKVGPVAAPAQAGMVRLLRYSNRAVDGWGQPRTGQVGMTFALYAEPEGGTPLWVETQNLTLDEEGRYTALLGITSSEGLPLELFSTEEARWLGVQVQGEVERPRVLLVSVPYALKAADAERLGGKPLSAFVLAEPSGGTGSAGTESGEVPIDEPNALIDGSGTTNFVAKFTSSTNIGNSLLFDNGTNVGIGNTVPVDKLTVNGNLRLIGQTTHQVQMNGAASAGRLGQDVNGFFFATDTPGKLLSFFTNAGAGIQRRMTVASDGNVGIGTISPASQLEVEYNNDNSNNAAIAIDNPSGSGQDVLDFKFAGTAQARLRKAEGGGLFISTEDGKQIEFFTAANARMTILGTDGNVGIGTQLPTRKLDVVGNAQAVVSDAGLSFGVILGKNTAGTGTTIGVEGNVASADGIGVLGSGVGVVGVQGQNDNPSGVGVRGVHNNIAVEAVGLLGSSTLFRGRVLGTETMRIKGDGSLQFADGTTPLLINAATCCNAGNRMIWAHNPLDLGWGIFYEDSTDEMHWQQDASTRILTVGLFSGLVGVLTEDPADPLDVNGDIRVGTGTTGCVKDSDATVIAGMCSSDIRMKKDIEPFVPVLDRLVQLTPVHFYWRAEEFPEKHFGSSRSYGLVAQEVEQVFADLVATDEEGYKAVNYSKLPLLLLQAVKELKAENDALRSELMQQATSLEAVRRLLEQQGAEPARLKAALE